MCIRDRVYGLDNLCRRLTDIEGINAANTEVVTVILAVGEASAKVVQTVNPYRYAPQIFLASDSTCEDLPAVYSPREGWGMELSGFFKSSVQIINKAKGGKSSRTFLNGLDPTAVPVIENDGRMEDILSKAQPGDYLFIQFGHNDRSTARPVQQTDPYLSLIHI